MKPLSERLNLYMDAGFPILYIATFEEDKADRVIHEAVGNREIVEWNVRGLFFRESKQKVGDISLLEALGKFAAPRQTGSEEFAKRYNLRRRVLVLKEAQQLLEVPEIVAQLKYLSERIVAGQLADANIVIIAPTPTVPKELEHYITILHMDYLTTTEIKKIIVDFCHEQELDFPYDDFLREKKKGKRFPKTRNGLPGTPMNSPCKSAKRWKSGILQARYSAQAGSWQKDSLSRRN